MHSDKFSDKELGSDVMKQQNPMTEKKKGEIEEVTRIQLETETVKLH